MAEKQLFSSKTKLNSKWALWFDDYNLSLKSLKQDYEKNLYLISSFDCIENFWRTINNIPSLNEMQVSSSYHLMKFGIKPLWEDKRNYPGSITKIKLEGKVDENFLKECFIFMISLEFADEYDDEEINGVSIRKKDEDDFLLEIWCNKKFEPKQFIESFTKNMGNHVNLKFSRLFYKNCNELVRAYKKTSINKNS